MNGQAKVGFALIAALVVCGFGTIVAPRLEPAQRRADREADRQVEKARRLLASYNPSLHMTSLLIADLAGSNVDLTLKDAGERIGGEEFQAIYGEELEAALGHFDPEGKYQPRGGTESQIREGVALQERVLADNSKLLKEALDTVESALAVEVGGATAAQHVTGNRLKGVILYHQARQEARRAALARAAINEPLSALSSLAERVRAVQPATSVVSTSRIDEQLAAVQGQIAAAEAERAKLAAESASINASIAQLEGQLAQARAAADSARAAMDDLLSRGQDFSSAEGFEAFKAEYERHSDVYQAALKAAHTAEFGVYPDARVDPPGDYVDGKLVAVGGGGSLSPSLGLHHYRAALNRVSDATKLVDATLVDLTDRKARLTADKAEWEAQENAAGETLASLRRKGAAALERLSALDAQASESEATAISLFKKSAQAFKTAFDGAEGRLREAAEKAREVSPTQAEFSAYTLMSEASDAVYHLRTEQAEALAGEAWILQQAHASALDQQNVVNSAAELLQLPGDAVTRLSEAVQTRLEQGRQAAQAASEVLQGVHGQLSGHWTVTAGYAGTSYLFVLFGDLGLLAEVRENYRSALDGRDDAPLTAPLKDRLDVLERR